MSDLESVRSAVDAAERAAAGGDFQQAARHLRDAVAHQEVALGPTHPDLASTLNNLGVVCERLGENDEAERCYRRACAIVSAAFPADHPFVATSRQNLEAFCAARGVPVEEPTGALPATPAPAAVAAPRVDPPPSLAERPPSVTATAPPAGPQATSPAPPLPGPAAPAPRSYRALMTVSIVLIAAAFWMSRASRTSAPASSEDTPVASAPPPPAAATSPPIEPAPAVPAATPEAPAPVAMPTPGPPRATTPPAAAGPMTVVSAELCRTLTTGATWTCAPVADPAGTGPVFFYTRVASPHDAVIVHRWYRNDELVLNRELHIQANASAGYRTYSRLTMDANSSGQWRVELRTPDGRVLREERFAVR